MKPYVNIICIMDKSGSMESIINEAILGFNTFLKDQQNADYKARLSLLLFDTTFEKVYNNVKIKDVQPLDRKTYRTGGGTSLLQAIGLELDSYLDFLAETPLEKRPIKTLFVVQTDGQENASKEYHLDLIKRMVTEIREYFPAEFIFLGADQNACFQAESMGMSSSNAFSYAATGEGIQVAYSKMASATNTYATTDAKENLFQDEKKS